MHAMNRLQLARRATGLIANVERGIHTRQRPTAQAPTLLIAALRRNASTTKDKSKPIVLEQPDKFRPPSHGARSAKSRGRGSTMSGSFNQASTETEREVQKTKRYPHMFPPEGTFMHSFLSNQILHLVITMSVLIFLAGVTYVQTFVKTSPFGHLMPSLTSLPFHPIKFFSDAWEVFVMDIDYNTEKVEFARANNILDTRKRRIYRRAHGMEDLDREEDQGVDVRGIVPWDDGLTKREREQGGIGANRIKMVSAIEVAGGQSKDEYIAEGQATLDYRREAATMQKEMFIRRRESELGLDPDHSPAMDALSLRKKEAEKLVRWTPTAQMEKRAEDDEKGAEADADGQASSQPPQRKKKLWLGIW